MFHGLKIFGYKLWRFVAKFQILAKYVVKPEWVVESFNSKWFLDEEKFWLKDERKEQLFQFSIRNRWDFYDNRI